MRKAKPSQRLLLVAEAMATGTSTDEAMRKAGFTGQFRPDAPREESNDAGARDIDSNTERRAS